MGFNAASDKDSRSPETAFECALELMRSGRYAQAFQKEHGGESSQKVLASKEADVAEYRRKLENYFKTVKAFAAGGVDIEEKNNYDKSALDIAVKSGTKKIAAFLADPAAETNPTKRSSAWITFFLTLARTARKGW
jgi:hypothetical protein